MPASFSFEHIARSLLRLRSEPFFVQIGAMDGVRFDPLFPVVSQGGWRGLLVEPLPDLFAALVENYRGIPGLQFANVAVTEKSGLEFMNRVDPAAIASGLVPEWAPGISSFFSDRNAVGGVRVGAGDFSKLKPYIIREQVQCVTLPELLAGHHVERVDLLQIDTEGYDYRILKQFDFARFRPTVIHLEYYHLPPDEQNECVRLLLSHGYVIGGSHKDFLATTLPMESDWLSTLAAAADASVAEVISRRTIESRSQSRPTQEPVAPPPQRLRALTVEPSAIWSTPDELNQGLRDLGLGDAQTAISSSLLKGHLPVMRCGNPFEVRTDRPRWSGLVISRQTQVHVAPVGDVLGPDALVMVIGSEDPGLDSFKLSLQEFGHIGVEALGGHEIWLGAQSSLGPSSREGELPLIACYYTLDTPYEAEAQRLIASCRSLGLRHEIRGIATRGSWEENCAMKAAFLRDLRRETGQPLLWVDADAVIQKSPELLRGATCDFAIRKVGGWQFNSATVFFGATQAADLLLEEWETLCRHNPHVWDQVLLDAAWESVMRKQPLYTRWLPAPYAAIFDEPLSGRQVDNVIVQYQASRRLKAVVSTATTPRPAPPIPAGWQKARCASRAWLDRAGNSLTMSSITNPDFVPLPGTPPNIPLEFSTFESQVVEWVRMNRATMGRVAIFGANWFGARLATRLRGLGLEPLLFFDNAPGKADSTLVGLRVARPSGQIRDVDVVLIASIGHSRTLEQQVVRAGESIRTLAAHQDHLGETNPKEVGAIRPPPETPLPVQRPDPVTYTIDPKSPQADFHSPRYLRNTARRLEHLATLGLDLWDKSVLEIGAGIGDLTTFFLDRHCTVHATEPRPDNLAILRARYAGDPNVTVDLLDLDPPPAHWNGICDIVFCYGVLYHVSNPASALDFMRGATRRLLLLETICVPHAGEAINPTPEDIGLAGAAFTGAGCRPTRQWVFAELKRRFAHVYTPTTQPNHREFPLDWTQPTFPAATRAIFVASCEPIKNPLLVPALLDRQHAS